VCVCVCARVCVFLCVFIYIYIHIYVCIYTDPIENAAAVPYLDIAAKGMGSNATIFFDRREVIVPLVPVGITGLFSRYTRSLFTLY
jgi:hypothetical protein